MPLRQPRPVGAFVLSIVLAAASAASSPSYAQQAVTRAPALRIAPATLRALASPARAPRPPARITAVVAPAGRIAPGARLASPRLQARPLAAPQAVPVAAVAQLAQASRTAPAPGLRAFARAAAPTRAVAPQRPSPRDAGGLGLIRAAPGGATQAPATRVHLPGRAGTALPPGLQVHPTAQAAQPGASTPDPAAQAAAAAHDQEVAHNLEVANARWRMDHAYEVEPLSYLPPKFADDGNASRFLVLVSNVHWSGGKGEFDWHAGESFELSWANNLMDADPPLFQQLWELASGILAASSQAYESAKLAVVGVAADAISASGVADCGASCRAGIKAGLEMALAAAGVPPKVPDVRELYGNGASYLAANLADAVIAQGIGVDLPGGVATDLAQAAARDQARAALYGAARAGVDTLVQQLGCADPSAANCGVDYGMPSTWGAPDPYFRRHPAVLYVRIRVTNPQLAAGSTPVSLVVQADGSVPTSMDLPLGYIPPEGVVVPIVLAPDPGAGWKVAGYMNGLDCECGQPYYWGGGSTVKLATVHQVVSLLGNAPFVVQQDWPALELDTAHAQDFQDGNIFDGFYGDNKPRFVYLPGG